MKTPRILSALFLLSLISLPLSAQRGLINFGVRGGITTQSVDYLKNPNDNFELHAKTRAGIQLGFYSRVNLAMFHLQPEILYSNNRYKMRVTDAAGNYSSSTVRLNQVDVPVLVGLKMIIFRVQVGPQFNLLTDCSVKSRSGNQAHSVTISRPSVSYIAGFGIDLGRYSFDARYNGQFKRPSQDVQIGSYEGAHYRTKYRNWALTIGYTF